MIVAQLGARMHYAVPRILYEAGALERFFTDICAVQGWPRLAGYLPGALCPSGLRRLLGRVPKGIPGSLITAFTSFGWQYARERKAARTPAEATALHLKAGKTFCELVIRAGFGGATGVYTFNSAGLELLHAARERGLRAIMEQTIAPKALEARILHEEQQRWPDWARAAREDEYQESFARRESAEWDAADTILCGSEFVRDGISACGGPVDKCRVVPYGVDQGLSEPVQHPPYDGSRELRVLTVGVVGLRKGSPYVLEAARRLRGRATFRMVGSIDVLPGATDALRRTVELTGPVPRTEVKRHFEWADVFLLPSLVEGSATVVYEALGMGLPVICTPNTGSVVQDNKNGFLVPIRDADAIVDRAHRLTDPALWEEQSRAARTRAADFTVAHYGRRLLSALKAGGH